MSSDANQSQLKVDYALDENLPDGGLYKRKGLSGSAASAVTTIPRSDLQGRAPILHARTEDLLRAVIVTHRNKVTKNGRALFQLPGCESDL